MPAWRFAAIGTTIEVDTDQPLPADLRAAVLDDVERFDRAWSRFRSDSVVRAIAGGGSAPAPADAALLLGALAALSTATRGAVSPLAGTSLEAIGYDAEYSLRAGEPVASDAWEGRLSWSEGTLRLDGPGVIDIGALGKGALVDRILDRLRAGGVGPATIDAGGDIRVAGRRERIGMEHPNDPSRAIGVWEVQDQALCASGVGRRAWRGRHHVLDARTGEPVRQVVATWASAPDAMRADAIATAVFFDGGPALADAWGASWVRVFTDGRVERSPGCPARLFTRARAA